MPNSGNDKSFSAFIGSPWFRQTITLITVLGAIYLGYLQAIHIITAELCSVRKTLAVLINIHAESDPQMMKIYGPLLTQKEDICSGLQ